MKALILGYFSTLGDYDSLEIVKRWITEAGGTYSVAPFHESIRQSIEGAIEPVKADPMEYTHVIVVCGPCWKPFYAKRAFIDPVKFSHCRFIGVNLTMIDPLSVWNPFDALFERDSDKNRRPDLTFLWERRLVPVIGLCLVRKQKAYKEKQLHEIAERKIRAFISGREAAVVEIDTAWPSSINRTGLRTPAEIESIIARVDILVTTRLHGMVYALKHGVPVIAVDAIKGGAKVTEQAKSIGWSQVFAAEDLTDEKLSASFDYCMSNDARVEARKSAIGARQQLSGLRESFVHALEEGPAGAYRLWPQPEQGDGLTGPWSRIFPQLSGKKRKK